MFINKGKKSMNRKERVKQALKFQETDIVPYYVDFTMPAYDKLAKYYNDQNFIDKIGNHFAFPTTRNLAGWKNLGNEKYQDEFGAIWNKTIDKDIGTVDNSMLPDPTLKNYIFPDPYKPGRFDGYEDFVQKNKDKFIVHAIGFSLFERAWTLRGMENLLMDMILNPSFVEELLDKIVEYNLGIIEQATKFDIDACYFGDDWGQQHGLIMGPNLWRKFIKPRLKKMYDRVHKSNLFVLQHSCGDIKELIPELIDIGLNVLNPFQPEVMDVYDIKKNYGKHLAFWGGLST
ncbi:MAG: uroporphyrinogen decarboxylase [Elusimicrobia bacterium CG_4_10_14_0_8_um_filter_37_32]|nr:MAG: uroporphyrinogen decarboxylase [Elusimicrobia bacterium CG02_land_8_20_14_3_00_37_13]PIZ12424.1 MAG: uroporphyrinogen decarboxylase [Elusimicrobia bacterium CG_4_10_14_0_8_um_filter_37_32]